MIKNYFKTAIRNLKRNKSFAIINILGLAVGIAACLLIFLVIQFETSFDNFHRDKKDIYRLGSEFHNQDGVSYSAGVPFPVGKALRIDYPQLKQVASIYRDNDNQVTIPGETTIQTKKFTEHDIYFTEPEFFKIFSFPWLTGEAKTSLSEPNTVVLTRETAEKYFGDWKTAIGKTIIFKNKYTYKITGILDNPPANTDFPLKIVISYASLKSAGLGDHVDTDWVSIFGDAYTFVVLPPELSQKKFNANLASFTKKHKPAEYAKDGIVLQPLREVHFDDRFGNYNHTFSRQLITTLLVIGIFLVIIACVNFINLATAQAINRSREVGVRKVLGSNRAQLAFQFISETAIITVFAILMAVGIAAVTLSFLNKLLDAQIAFSLLTNPALILFLLAAMVVITLLSGIYPAMVLSGFNPINALKSRVTAKMVGGLSLRRGLVVMQFTIAHILIIGTIIVVGQTDFFRNASLGFDKAAIINVPVPGDSISHTKIDFLRTQLLQNPDITNVAFSYASPSDNSNWSSDFKFDHAPKATNFGANLKWADADYFKTYRLQFVAGRPYYPSDTVREFVVNEKLLKKLGIKDPKEAIGKQLDFWNGIKVANIVGVIKDFNSTSLRNPIAPVVLSTWKDVYQVINIKIKPGREKETLAFVEKLWNGSFPDYVYRYGFLDEKIAGFYRQEDQLSKLYKIFAGIAIFISCLGLYGLVSFMAAQRIKEVGIRKVLGASAANIVYMFSKEFTVLILVAFVIAAPIAWYIMNKWLQDFSYRITPGIGVFVLAIAGSMVIAWLTVGYRAIKAAIANPVKSLRAE